MKKQIDFRIVSLVFSVLVICFAIAFYVVAWDEPGAGPPGDNVPAPLNVSNDPQIKSGSLRLGGLTVDNDTSLATSAGNVGIGTTSPSVGEEALKLDVEGAIGATKYCDENGNNCKTITEMVGGVCANEQILKYNGATWECADEAAGGGGGATYDSGWFRVSANNTYTIDHGLGVIPKSIDVYLSDKDDASRTYYVKSGVPGHATHAYVFGTYVWKVTSTQITILAAERLTEVIGWGSPVTGWARIIAIE